MIRKCGIILLVLLVQNVPDSANCYYLNEEASVDYVRKRVMRQEVALGPDPATSTSSSLMSSLVAALIMCILIVVVVAAFIACYCAKVRKDKQHCTTKTLTDDPTRDGQLNMSLEETGKCKGSKQAKQTVKKAVKLPVRKRKSAYSSASSDEDEYQYIDLRTVKHPGTKA